MKHMRGGPWLLACALASSFACSEGGGVTGDEATVPSNPAAGTSRPSLPAEGSGKRPNACQRDDIEIRGSASDPLFFAVEVSSRRQCTVGLASYQRPGGGPETQEKYRDTGGKNLMAREETTLVVALPCGAWQTDLYFNLDTAPDRPNFHGGNLVKGWMAASSCSGPSPPPSPIPCIPPCQGRDICVNGVCLPPNPP